MKKALAALLAYLTFAGPAAAQVVESLSAPQAAPELSLPSPAAAQGQDGGASPLFSPDATLGADRSLPVEGLPGLPADDRSLSDVRTLDAQFSQQRGAAPDLGAFERFFDRSASPAASLDVPDGHGLAAAPAPKHVHEKGVYSNNRLKTFEWSPEDYALEYLLDAHEDGPKPFQFLVGLAVHETMEKVYKAVKDGRDGRTITEDEVVGIYHEAFDRGLSEESYASKDDFTPEEYRRRGEIFIRRKFQQLQPFDLPGTIVSIEDESRFDLVDPANGRAYKFYMRPDRIRVVGDTVLIEDWKTHANPPSLEQLKKDDYQLGLYAIGLQQLQPELTRGRKIKLVWHYKEFSHELDADPAYLNEVRDRVLRVLHGIETFTSRVEGEKAQWLKRANPSKAAAPAAIRKQLDQLGSLESKARAKRLELRQLDAMIREKEEGLVAYADAKKVDEIEGKGRKAVFTRKSEKKLPTLESDPEGNAEVVRILQKEGAWEDFSQLQYAALKSFAERQGHPAHAAFDSMRPHLKFSHSDELVVREKSDDLGALAGVARSRLHPETEAEQAREPGVYSASRLSLFEKDPKAYALHYLFGVKHTGPLSYEFLVGLACHQTLEDLFNAVKGGRRGQDIRFADVINDYRRHWKEGEADGRYKAARGWTAQDYRIKGEEYLRAKWEQLYPFDNGQILYLERRMHFDIQDPQTGKVFRFQGIPDRVMIEGDTVVIHDWKTHFVPLTEEHLRAEDFQLALYAYALRQLFPGLMAGKKIRLVWDFKDKPVVIDADDAYIHETVQRVIKLLRDVETFTAEVEKDREKWERLAGSLKPPKSAAEAKRWVNDLAKLKAQRDARDEELKALTSKQAPLRQAVLDYALASGQWEVEGAKYSASVRKKPQVEIPTKTADPKANAALIQALKDAGLWHEHSQLSYPALKAALKKIDDPKTPHRETLKKVAALLQDSSETKLKLEPSAPAEPTAETKGK